MAKDLLGFPPNLPGSEGFPNFLEQIVFEPTKKKREGERR